MNPEFLAFLYGIRAGAHLAAEQNGAIYTSTLLDRIIDAAESYADHEAEASIEGEGRDFRAVDPDLDERLYEAVRPALDGMVRDALRYGRPIEAEDEFDDGGPYNEAAIDPAVIAREMALWASQPQTFVVVEPSPIADLWKRATDAELDRSLYSEPLGHSVEDAFDASAADNRKAFAQRQAAEREAEAQALIRKERERLYRMHPDLGYLPFNGDRTGRMGCASVGSIVPVGTMVYNG